ncbi:MAG: DUF3368 domain-containing protein [Promethearchaeota archaeon]
MIAIINASPLIYLGKIGALEYLPKIFEKCITTKEVKREVLNKREAPEYPILEKCFKDWIEVKNPSNQDLIKKLEETMIHYGEASIIALAKELKEQEKENIIIIDDLAAREIARTLNLEITGTIGIIIKILKLNLINSEKAKEYINFLVERTSFRISISLYIKVLDKIDKMKRKK